MADDDREQLRLWIAEDMKAFRERLDAAPVEVPRRPERGAPVRASSPAGVARILVARYDGKCSSCGHWYSAGDEIRWAPRDARHVDCDAARERAKQAADEALATLDRVVGGG